MLSQTQRGSRVRRIGRIFSAMLFSVILVGCAIRQTPQSRPRIALRGFSFAPPAGEGWEDIPRLETTKAEFASRDADNLLWARARSFDVAGDASANSDRVLDVAYSVAVIDQVRGLGNDAQIVWSRSQPEEIAGAQCLRNDALFKNKAIYSLSTGVICSHPESPTYIVVLDYSRKWREPSAQRDDESQGEAFLDSLQFGPLPEFADAVVSRGPEVSSLAR